MSKSTVLQHKFVESVPRQLEPDTLYVSIRFATVIHQCCCGCGMRMVTPLSPSQWSVTFDGQTISLHPSIGNWSSPCRSHYWIRENKVIWARDITADQVRKVEQRDIAANRAVFDKVQPSGPKANSTSTPSNANSLPPIPKAKRWWSRR